MSILVGFDTAGRQSVTTLEEQFALLVAGMTHSKREMPNVNVGKHQMTMMRSRTVYSVGEAISNKIEGQNAKLGAGAQRDSGARR
jgi:hypothetical protein